MGDLFEGRRCAAGCGRLAEVTLHSVVVRALSRSMWTIARVSRERSHAWTVRAARSRPDGSAARDAMARADLGAPSYAKLGRDRHDRGATADALTTPLRPLERYEAVIGIEVHCQLQDRLEDVLRLLDRLRRRRRRTPTSARSASACPGALPTINRRAVEHVLATGVAIEATTPAATRWDRKNYFYPDLPKGYQISQYDLPLASAGPADVRDVGRPVHGRRSRGPTSRRTRPSSSTPRTPTAGKVSLVDFNRSGAPLMEIVTEPDIRTAEQARRYAEELQLLLRTIGASDADMERGQMRVEANVSLRPRGTEPFGTRVEVKNMNSFRSVERAIEFEIERQAAALDAGETLVQETRGWAEDRGATYRHAVQGELATTTATSRSRTCRRCTSIAPGWTTIRAGLPELPAARRARYRRRASASSPYDAAVLVADPGATALFEATLAADPALDRQVRRELGHRASTCACATPRQTSRVPRRRPPSSARSSPAVEAGTISRANAQGGARGARDDRRAGGVDHRGARVPPDLRQRRARRRPSTRSLAANPAAVADYRAGKAQAVGFLVGQVMKATRGQANAALVQAAVRERLDGRRRRAHEPRQRRCCGAAASS